MKPFLILMPVMMLIGCRAKDDNTSAALEKNKTVVRRIVDEIINQAKSESFDELVDENFVDHTGGPGGRDGYRKTITDARTAFPDLQMKIDDIIAEGDKVALRLSWTATHKGTFFEIPPTGNTVSVTAMGVFRIADGKMVERWNLTDVLGLLRQLGAVGGTK